MTLKSLIFDFDGLILDTETPDFLVWQSIYHEYGQEFPVDEWLKIVGGHGRSDFDAAGHLAGLVDRNMDIRALRERHRIESDQMTSAQRAMPGVEELLSSAGQAGLKLAIASSSDHSWVDRHLARLGLLDRFDRIVCLEDVAPGRTKPHPDLFIKVLELLHIQAREAIVFEDSLNGVRAARAAGLFVVAVPNHVTSLLGVDGADLQLSSLHEFQLDDFIKPAS